MDDFEYQLRAEKEYGEDRHPTEDSKARTYVDANDGVVYEWDANRGGWFPKVNTISGEICGMVGRVGPGETFDHIFVPRPEDLEIYHAILLNVFGVGEAWEQLVAPCAVATAEYVCFLICDRLMRIS